jgi:hypothetical protein
MQDLHTDFYEKALFVKPTWRLMLSVAECSGFCALRALCFYSAVNKL